MCLLRCKGKNQEKFVPSRQPVRKVFSLPRTRIVREAAEGEITGCFEAAEACFRYGPASEFNPMNNVNQTFLWLVPTNKRAVLSTLAMESRLIEDAFHCINAA